MGRPICSAASAIALELRVEQVSRAARQAGVAVAGDGPQLHRHPRPPALAAVRNVRERRDRIDVGEVETPGDQPLERLHRGRRRFRRLEVADQRDSDAPGVEPERVRADHVARDAAVPPLVDAAEAVDEEVVADVVPAVRPYVVDVDPAHDGGGLVGRVGVRRRRVVDDDEPDRRGILRVIPAEELVAAPSSPRHDRRRAGHREAAQRLVLDRAPDVPRPQPGHVTAHAVLQRVGGARPGRVRVVRRLPGAPAAQERTGAEAHRARPLPTQADHVEPPWRHASRQAPAHPRPAALATRSSHRRAPRSLRPPTGRRGARAVRPDRLSSRPLAFDRYQ